MARDPRCIRMEQVAPEVKDITEEELPGTGQWYQKFTLFMPGDPVTEQLFYRTGTKLDLADPQVRIDLWNTLNDQRFTDGD
jgi:hypothetical protein